MQITDEVIGQRRITYICCAMSAMAKYLVGKKYGDASCDKWRKQWLYLLWAKSVADRTPLSTETSGCVSYETASAVFEKADCYCAQCGCPPEDDTIIYPPPSDPCAVTATYTVIGAVDVDERLIIEAAGPVIGDSYFVVSDSGGSGWTVNTIVTWNGSGWDSFTPTNGDVVDAGGVFWVTYANDEPGLLFPGVTATLVNNPDGAYIIQSDDPQIALYSGRNVRLEILTPGGWIAIPQYQPFIPEVQIASPIPFDSTGTNFTQIRAAYVDGDCTYQGPTGTVVPPVGSCGTIVVDVTAQSDCGEDQFFINVDIQSAEGFPLGDLVATVNGGSTTSEQAVLGTTLLGPYDTGDVVNIRIENSFDSECDFDAGDFVDPSYPVADRTVLAAVDVSFEGSQVLGESYLIATNTGNITNAWSPYVGQVFNGAIFIPLNEGEIVEATSVLGFDRYWQRVSGVTVQMYPPVILQNVQSFPYPWQVISASPDSAVTRFRPAVVEAMFDGEWLPIWVGLENSLATGQQVDFTSIGLLEPQQVRVTYFGTDCPITIDGTIVSEPVELEFECGGPEQILGSGDLYDIYYDWNDGLYLITSDDDDLINSGDPIFADLAIGDIIDVDATYVSTPAPGTLLYLSNGGGAYYIVGTQPGEIILSPYQGVGQVFMFTQQPSSLQTWTFTSDDPGNTVTIYFVAGTMGSFNVLRIYDGTDDSGTPITSGNFASLAGLSTTSLSNSMYMEAESNNDPTDTQTPWIFIVNCTSSSIPAVASASPVDNCTDYNFSIDIDIIDVGDSAGGVVNIQYVVDNVVTTVAGVGTGITTIGPFDYDDTVQVYIRNLTDSSADLWLGSFQSSGTCKAPPNPCLPDAVFKIDIVGDLSELPVPPPNPSISELFFVLSDNDNIGTFEPGSILAWSMMAQEWEFLFVLPEGGFIYGPMTEVIGVVEQATVFGNGPAGPYLDFAPIIVGINPNSTGVTDNIRIRLEEVGQGFITTDRPIKLQVFSEGEWVDVWFGTEQMLIGWTIIGVPFPFTLTRSVYNYDTCAVEAAYIIDVQQGLQTP